MGSRLLLSLGVALVLIPSVSAAGVTGSPGLSAGEWIVFASDRDGDSELYASRPDGTELRRLTRNRVEDFFPAVSPDGRWIAFVSSRSGGDDVYVMSVDGTGLRALTRNSQSAFGSPIQDEAPSWSPDGLRIAFASNRIRSQFDVFVMRADGTRVRRLTRTGGRVADTIPAGRPTGR